MKSVPPSSNWWSMFFFFNCLGRREIRAAVQLGFHHKRETITKKELTGMRAKTGGTSEAKGKGR